MPAGFADFPCRQLHAANEPVQCCFIRRRGGALHVQPACPLGTLKGSSMEKWLCWSSLGISGTLLRLFLLDMLLYFPFGGMGYLVNGIGIVSCGLVGYLAW